MAIFSALGQHSAAPKKMISSDLMMTIFHLLNSDMIMGMHSDASLNILCEKNSYIYMLQRQPGKTWKRVRESSSWWHTQLFSSVRIRGDDMAKRRGVDEVAVCMWQKFSCFLLLCWISIEKFSFHHLLFNFKFFSSHKKSFMKSDIFILEIVPKDI